MTPRFGKIDYLLWILIILYTGIIYATLSIVSELRKSLLETYGPDVFDQIYWIFAFIGALLVFYCFRQFKGKQLVQKLTVTALIACIYCFYLSGMQYPVERIHFLEYGLLGALILAAFSRHINGWVSIILSLNLVYWIGLGDEAVQYMLPHRVGEIRDSIMNLLSGALGIALLWFTGRNVQNTQPLKIKHLKIMILFLGVTTVATTMFLYKVHGFGYRIVKKDPGIIYTSLSPELLEKINNKTDAIPPQQLEIYENEALRHLFQREFYYTNISQVLDGMFYNSNLRCYCENRILEIHYPRYLQEHANDVSGDLISNIDREVSQKVKNNPVVWSIDTREQIANSIEDKNSLYSSRVKNVIITSFTLQDLLFSCVLICIILGYLWAQLHKNMQ